jgi:hypothetical protein
MHATGTFDVTAHHEPPYASADGVSLGRSRFDKRFHGPLSATSEVQMIGVRTPSPADMAYVAVERIEGTLDGRAGSFVVLHLAQIRAGARSLELVIAPGTGTGALAGIDGRMQIRIEGGQHFYEIEYALPA